MDIYEFHVENLNSKKYYMLINLLYHKTNDITLGGKYSLSIKANDQ